MTREDLLNLPHLNIAEVTRLVHIHTEDGYLITSYFDGMDIKEYCSTNCMYFPIHNDYAEYRVITAEEDEEYVKLHNEAINEEPIELTSEVISGTTVDELVSGTTVEEVISGTTTEIISGATFE